MFCASHEHGPLTFEDSVLSFLHWNEHTSTSPSGCRLGLYKSLLTAHCDSGGEFDDAETDSGLPPTKIQATDILTAIHSIALCVAKRGLYLQRWIYVINVMIYKKPGVLKLDKLRVIHLFEADFNLLVGMIFGRRTVHNAVDHKRLHPSQYGKKCGECMDAAISKVLHNTITTYSKTPMGNSKVTPQPVLTGLLCNSRCSASLCTDTLLYSYNSGWGSSPIIVTK
jgi:hypothetical protein